MIARRLSFRAMGSRRAEAADPARCIIQHDWGDLVREAEPTTDPDRTPRVSVILVTYMRAADMSRCLDSLVAQTYKDFEVLVCDDGSTDGTEEVVRRYAGALNLRYLWSENSGGPARPRNTGLKLARGAYAAFLDSDDWWKPRKLELCVQALDGGADVVYHDIHLARKRGQRVYLRRRNARTLRAPAFENLICDGNAMANSSVVVRRDLIRCIGGFSEGPSFAAWEDFDAWLRVSKVTERLVRLNQPLGYIWVGGGNMSSASRTIRILQNFHDLYIAPDPRWRDAPLPAWYHYSLGLCYTTLGTHALALRHIVHALREGLPVTRSLKALFTAAVLSARVVTGSGRGR
jgi:glycosyltransferase involved in cell wall biosynthesis